MTRTAGKSGGSRCVWGRPTPAEFVHVTVRLFVSGEGVSLVNFSSRSGRQSELPKGVGKQIIPMHLGLIPRGTFAGRAAAATAAASAAAIMMPFPSTMAASSLTDQSRSSTSMQSSETESLTAAEITARAEARRSSSFSVAPMAVTATAIALSERR